MSSMLTVIEILEQLSIRQGGQVQSCQPGDWIVLEVRAADVLIKKASTKVKVIGRHAIEPAATPDGSPLPAVYWERPTTGVISGPANPEFFTTDEQGVLWLALLYQEQTVWIRSEALRTRTQFEQQRPLQEMEPVREVREMKEARRSR
jgi:hypothetical protein